MQETSNLDILLLCVNTLDLFDTALGFTLAFVCKPLQQAFREHVGGIVQKRAKLSPQQLQEGLSKSCVLRITNFADAACSYLPWCQSTPLALLTDDTIFSDGGQRWERRSLQRQMLFLVRSKDYVGWLWLLHLLETRIGFVQVAGGMGTHTVASQFLWRLIVQMLLADSTIHFVDLMVLIARSERCGEYSHPMSCTFGEFDAEQKPIFTHFPEAMLSVIRKSLMESPSRTWLCAWFCWLASSIRFGLIDVSVLDCIQNVAITQEHLHLVRDVRRLLK